MAKRQCNDHAQWLAPDFSDCVSDEYTNLNENVRSPVFITSYSDVKLRYKLKSCIIDYKLTN